MIVDADVAESQSLGLARDCERTVAARHGPAHHGENSDIQCHLEAFLVGYVFIERHQNRRSRQPDRIMVSDSASSALNPGLSGRRWKQICPPRGVVYSP